MTREQIKNILLVAVPFVITLALTWVLQITLLARPELAQKWLESLGLWFIVVYAAIQTTTIVIPPLGSLFAQIAAVSLLGPIQGTILFYLVATPAFCINFYLARRFGRPLVERIISRDGLKKLDEVFADAGLGTLIILKVLQGGQFDYVSYAAGLSKITWKHFLLVNFLGGIPYSIIFYFVFAKSEDLVRSVIILQVVTVILVAVSFGINHYRHTKNPAKGGASQPKS